MARDACGAKLGTIESSTRLTFLGAGDVVGDIGVLCKRVKAASLEARVEGSGRDRIVIEVPSKDVRAATGLARTGRLAFYDWEANVIGPSGKPAPADLEVTGGPAAGKGPGELDYYAAVLRASKRPADSEADNARKGSSFYAVDPKEEKVFGRAAPTRAAALDSVSGGRSRRGKDPRSQAGHGGPARRAGSAGPRRSGRSLVLRPARRRRARAGHIRDPSRTSPRPGSGEPIVTFEFTSVAGSPSKR